MSDYNDLIRNTVFAETKDINDAIAIAWVIRNRMANPKRFGDTVEKVIYAPKQFTGVNTEEFKKAKTRRFTTSNERSIYDAIDNIVTGVMGDVIPDPTSGADHYYNPDLASPSWGKQYPVTYKGTQHLFLKEVPLSKRSKK